ncbi:hypothetical protein ACFZA1_37560 [Streptomyces filipinensis]|uniref:hypothetical protein n=1 Tax=Streptomyces filipinensis TaxID=66887 RepID=UPI0036EF418E
MSDRTVRLAPGTPQDVDDQVLFELTEDFEASSPEDVMKGGETVGDLDNPFDLAITSPRALDVSKLYEHANQPVPANIQAALGPKRAILLVHNITPFARSGTRPPRLWGLGYTARPSDVRATTVSLLPEDGTGDKLALGANVAIGLSVSGSLAIPDEQLSLLAQLPGVSVEAAKLSATADARFAVALDWRLTVTHVQSGPLDSGGARWNLYQSDDGLLTEHHVLLHTLLLPEDDHEITVHVDTWMRTSSRWFAWRKGHHWDYPPKEFIVELG